MPILPKVNSGDIITSSAWNNIIDELNLHKVNKAGDTMTGPLSIGGATSPAPALRVTGHLDVSGHLRITDAAGTPYPSNWIGMAENIEGTTKWLHIGGITDAGQRRLALFANKTYVSGRLGLGTNNPDATLHINWGSDVNLSGPSGMLIIGQSTGSHIAIDNNEIMSKANGTTVQTLHFQANGGDVALGGNLRTSGNLQASGDLRLHSDHRPDKIRLWNDGNNDWVSHGIGTASYHNIYGASSTYPSSIGHRFYSGGGRLIAQIGFGGNGTPANRLQTYFAGRVGIRATILGNDWLDVRGRSYSSGGWHTSNGDYAEYFEAEKGKTIDIGTSVTFNSEGKIKVTQKNETPIGIISAAPAILGASFKEWPKKYLRDDFGNYIMEEYQEEDDEINTDNQITGKKLITKTRKKLNPDFDESKEYISREERPEWNCVGLLGQLPLKKGQVVAPSWVKIKDISKNVELWLVK